jgi:hypothetical protein
MAELFTTSLFSDANLQMYQRFEGNSNDSKGSNNGTDTAITYNTTNAKYGQSANFVTASSSKIVLSTVAALQPTAKFSVTAWIKPNNGAADTAFFQSYAQSTSVAGLICGLSSGKARFLIGKNTGTTLNTDFKDLSSTATVNDGNIHHVVWVYDQVNMKMYIDNVLDTNTAATINPAYQGTTYCRIGCQNATGSDTNFLGGSIDDLSLFNRDLSAAEVAILFKAGSSMNRNYSYFM